MTTEQTLDTEELEAPSQAPDESVQPEGVGVEQVEGRLAPQALPVEAPDEPVADVPAVPVATDPQVQERLAYLEKLNRDYQAKATQEAAATAIAQLQQELIDVDGVSPARAKAIAEQQVMAQRNAEAQIREAHAKALYAARLASQHKKPEMVEALLEYNTIETMTAAAQKMAAEGKLVAENAALKAELAKWKKGQVPPQSFEKGTGAGESGLDYTRLLREGKPLPSPSEIDKLTAKFLR